MSIHVPGFQSFFRFLHYFVLTNLATSSIRVKRLEFPPGYGFLSHQDMT